MRRLGFALAIVTAVLAGCSKESSPTSGGGADSGESQGLAPPGEESAPGGDAALGGGGGTAAFGTSGAAEVPAVGPTVIKTGEIAVEVDRDGFGDAMSRVTAIAARHGGFVLSSTREGEESRRGSVVIRVASDRFETAVNEIKALGTVRREHLSGEDVGQEFVDLEARLRNLHAQEAVLLRLFDEAASVADTIRIQSELSAVQLDIEQIEGRLRYLRDQAALGTITVALFEEGASAPGLFAGAFERAVDGFLGILAGLVIFIGYALPIAALALGVWLVGRRVMRALEKRSG